MLIKKDPSEVLPVLDEISDIGWWEWDIKDNKDVLSLGFRKTLGYNEEDKITWKSLIHEQDMPKAIQAKNKHFDSAGKMPYHVEARYKHKDGSTVWLACRGKVVEWDDNGPVRMIGAAINITEIKESQKKLKQKVKELEGRDKTLKSIRELIKISKEMQTKHIPG